MLVMLYEGGELVLVGYLGVVECGESLVVV